MAKSNYKTKPFAEWTEEDFQQRQADILASYESMFAKMSEEATEQAAE